MHLAPQPRPCCRSFQSRSLSFGAAPQPAPCSVRGEVSVAHAIGREEVQAGVLVQGCAGFPAKGGEENESNSERPYAGNCDAQQGCGPSFYSGKGKAYLDGHVV